LRQSLDDRCLQDVVLPAEQMTQLRRVEGIEARRHLQRRAAYRVIASLVAVARASLYFLGAGSDTTRLGEAEAVAGARRVGVTAAVGLAHNTVSTDGVDNAT
jgi:hypothetical protein